MSTYAFRPVSDLKGILAAHRQRGFRVLVLGAQWARVRQFSQTVGETTEKDHTMVATSLARRIHEADKRGAPLFGQPTLIVVVDPTESLAADGVAWAQIQAAAERSDSDVVFAHT